MHEQLQQQTQGSSFDKIYHVPARYIIEGMVSTELKKIGEGGADERNATKNGIE